MERLSILIVGVAQATSVVANDKAEIERLNNEIEALKAKQEIHRLREELTELNKGPTVNHDQIKHIDGTYYLKGEKEPFTGTSIWYHDNGSKYLVRPYVDGKIHGTIFSYYKNGSIYERTPYVEGKQHSTQIWYYEGGSREREYPFVSGKMHGTQIWYYDEGSKALEIVYENGKEISRKEF